MDKEIYLLRHGDTGYAGHYIGSTDVPLSSDGVLQVENTSLLFSKLQFDQVLCSPLRRCRESAQALNLECRVQLLDVLQEINFGRWEEKTFSQIDREDKKLVESWVANPKDFAFPEGESMKSFYSRIEEATSYLEKSKAKKILVVSHGGVIRHLLCFLLRVPVSQYLLYEIAFGALATVRMFPEGGVLTGLNLRGKRV